MYGTVREESDPLPPFCALSAPMPRKPNAVTQSREGTCGRLWPGTGEHCGFRSLKEGGRTLLWLGDTWMSHMLTSS